MQRVSHEVGRRWRREAHPRALPPDQVQPHLAQAEDDSEMPSDCECERAYHAQATTVFCTATALG